MDLKKYFDVKDIKGRYQRAIASESLFSIFSKERKSGKI